MIAVTSWVMLLLSNFVIQIPTAVNKRVFVFKFKMHGNTYLFHINKTNILHTKRELLTKHIKEKFYQYVSDVFLMQLKECQKEKVCQVFRSSRMGGECKKAVLEKIKASCFSKTLASAFSCKFCESFRNSFLQNTSRRLLRRLF